MMRCKSVEQWILLEATGELSPRRGARLRNHLVACDRCRAWRASTAAITAGAREALAAGEPSETTMIAIRREARVRTGEAARPLRPSPWLRPAYGLATAALCLLVVGGWWLRPSPEAFGGQAQLRTILLMLSEESHAIDRVDAVRTVTAEGALSLDALASELLALQGLDETYTEAELREPAEWPQATAPLARSTPALPAKRYV